MAGVDYEAILRAAEKEADVIVWDGGNNDWPFYVSDLEIVALDPHRLGHERAYYPGEVNFLRADVLVINKVNTAEQSDDRRRSSRRPRRYNPGAKLVLTASDIAAADPDALAGKRVLAVEDGPTVTHGGMPYGAAALAAEAAGRRTRRRPRPTPSARCRDTFAAYPHMDKVLPAMGYSAEQLADLAGDHQRDAVRRRGHRHADRPGRLIEIRHPSVRVTYRVVDTSAPTLDSVIDEFCAKHGIGS